MLISLECPQIPDRLAAQCGSDARLGDGQVLRNSNRSRHVAAERWGHRAARLDRACRRAGRGAFMILYLKIQTERIAATKYHTVGCGPTIASGSMLTEVILGRTLEERWALTVENLIDALDGMPPDKIHCPALAIAALRDALSKWNENEQRMSAGD